MMGLVHHHQVILCHLVNRHKSNLTVRFQVLDINFKRAYKVMIVVVRVRVRARD